MLVPTTSVSRRGTARELRRIDPVYAAERSFSCVLPACFEAGEEMRGPNRTPQSLTCDASVAPATEMGRLFWEVYRRSESGGRVTDQPILHYRCPTMDNLRPAIKQDS